jgi:hypothetical protein
MIIKLKKEEILQVSGGRSQNLYIPFCPSPTFPQPWILIFHPSYKAECPLWEYDISLS